MAQIPFRINLGASGFPFLSELSGRTIVVPQLDQSAPRTEIEPVAVPCAYYMHNVIPTAQGYSSVVYQLLNLAPADTDNTFLNVFVIRDAAGNKAYLAVTTSGRNYILKTYLSGWIRTTDVAPLVAGGLVTTAYVNGVTYIYYQQVGCYTYNFATNVLAVQALTGLTANLIFGITTSNGFLIAYGSAVVYWSSTVSVTDFTPSIITGAGGGAVQDLKGAIVTVIPHKLGFMIYSTYNIVVGIYTANIRYPFALKEVVGSGGLANARLVDKDPVSGDHYLYGTSGVQLATSQITNSVFPELTDFLAGGYFEDYDESTGVFTTTFLSAPMVKKITSVADRYVVFSYGISVLTHALIFDTALNRFGKLKFTHVDCFEYLLLGAAPVDAPRNSIGFLQADGTVKLLSMAINAPYADGTIMFGKFQLTRQSICDLLSVEMENVRQDASLTVHDRATLDGKNLSARPTGYLAQTNGLFRQYRFRSSGLNHSLEISGAFNFTSIVMYFGQGGWR